MNKKIMMLMLSAIFIMGCSGESSTDVYRDGSGQQQEGSDIANLSQSDQNQAALNQPQNDPSPSPATISSVPTTAPSLPPGQQLQFQSAGNVIAGGTAQPPPPLDRRLIEYTPEPGDVLLAFERALLNTALGLPETPERDAWFNQEYEKLRTLRVGTCTSSAIGQTSRCPIEILGQRSEIQMLLTVQGWEIAPVSR